MAEKVFGPVITDADIRSELRKRSQTKEFKTLKASKWPLIMEKVGTAEKEGWKKEKRNVRSYKVSRPKPLDEQLEDELWCLVAKMGFTDLSSGRLFQIETKVDPNPRQIDVFAKDDEVALVIECTQRKSVTKSSIAKMSNLIDKIAKIKGQMSAEISNRYKGTGKLKSKFVIATRNIEWGDADLEKCEKANICVLADREIDYYKELTKHSKTASRFQMLAHFFADTPIPGLSKEVLATKGTMGKVNFYNFLIEPSDLLKISYISHMASRTHDDFKSYQRMLQSSRLKSIASYIKSGGVFPTNIIVNLKKLRNRSLVFEDHSTKEGVTVGTLKLPNTYGSAWVIDGQHRLYGYAYLDQEDTPKTDKTVLPVLAFENLPAVDEMNMFIDINSKQVKVKTSLLIELYANLHWNSSEPSERLLALQARIVSQLNSLKSSPIFDRVVVTGTRKTAVRCLTATSLSDGLKQAGLLGGVRKEVFHPGPLSHRNPEKTDLSLKKATKILSDVLELFAVAIPENWNAGDKQGEGYLCTNIGIRSVMLVLMNICDHIGRDRSSNLSIWNEADLLEEIKVYMQPVVEYFAAADNEQTQAFRKQGSSLDSVKKQSMGMNVFINEKHPGYQPPGLNEYINSRDQEGNEAALLKITRIQERLNKHVLTTLKANFRESDDDWLVKGIPIDIRTKTGDKWEKEDRVLPQESYLYLINYQDIAQFNWNLFQEAFKLGEKDKDNKAKCTKWIAKLNDIRQKTHHPEKGKLTDEEMKFVDKISDKVDEFFPN